MTDDTIVVPGPMRLDLADGRKKQVCPDCETWWFCRMDPAPPRCGKCQGAKDQLQEQANEELKSNQGLEDDEFRWLLTEEEEWHWFQRFSRWV